MMLLILFSLLSGLMPQASIDRHALVTRHNVHLTAADPLSPLSLGNGEFAFTFDITGLQSYPEFHETGMPLGTLSQWGWHSFPNPDKYTAEDALSLYGAHGRQVPYLDGSGELRNGRDPQRAKRANAWLRANPHRIDLGRIGLELRKSNGARPALQELRNTEQDLDLWRAMAASRFELEGEPVRVWTVSHPERDAVAVRIESALLATGRLVVSLAFPYPAGDWQKTADWSDPGRHRTVMACGTGRCDFARTIDATSYFAALSWSGEAGVREAGAHRFELQSRRGRVLEFSVEFSPSPITAELPGFEAASRAAARHWQKFWTTGGAIDLSGNTDQRARELERRIVLSQYLTAIQCAGSTPPQETGLTANSWFGKFHLEMHWWHAAHFALWGRAHLLEKSMPWYQRILPAALAAARAQGYRGARWPKMTGPGGVESPSPVGVFLAWQQPHPIFYAELLYRARPDRRTLERYRGIVQATAGFMASFATWDGRRYVLGPPLIPAQESYSGQRRDVVNPTFELVYWSWGLQAAQRWRQRLGLQREPEWDKVASALARPSERSGVYAAIEVSPFTVYSDHPSMLAALGVLPPSTLVDPAVMARTLDDVRARWDWSSTWGWDYPMMAMTAVRLGRPEEALECLLMDAPKNRYLVNGHNYQRANLPLYLPGNGGLLYAAAMMAAGWDGAPTRPAPGFPADWTVKYEGLAPAP